MFKRAGFISTITYAVNIVDKRNTFLNAQILPHNIPFNFNSVHDFFLMP